MNARSLFSLIILFFSMLTYAQADEYEVSGVSNPEYFNGIYSREGTRDSRPYYKMDTSESWSGSVYLYYGAEGWSIGNFLGDFADIYNPSGAWTPPATGWFGGGGGDISVVRPGPRISYSNKEWLESFENDGSFEQTAQITIDNSNGQIFTGNVGDDFVALGYAIVGNVPEGLTAVLIKEHDLGLKLFFDGQAIASSHADSVEVSVSFQDAAFENGTAEDTRGSLVDDLLLRFRDEHWVGSGRDYTTISAAVADANPDDIIRIDAGTYTERLTISKNLSIIGAGAGETIVQAAAESHVAGGRVFYIVHSLTDILLSDMTIRHGNVTGRSVSGGGVEARSPITIRNCEVVDNRVVAGGGSGGGIYADAGLVLENCLIARNQYISTEDRQSAGGGVFSSSRTTMIINSTIYDNQLSTTVANRNQTLRGGGISIRQVFNEQDVGIFNSTIVYNSNDREGGGLVLDNITSSNGIELVNNIVLNNVSDSDDADIFTRSISNSVVNIRHSIIGDVPDAGFVHMNIVNSENVDPQFDHFGNYGGNTSGFQLLSGSPAIGAGLVMDGVPDLDQRGYSRSGNPDIGAFQYDATLPVYVTYHANGGSGSAPELGHSLSTGKTFIVSGAGSLTWANRAFDGWNTSPDGSGEDYGPGDIVAVDTTDIDLYAQWVQTASYTLTYNAGIGGSIDGDVSQTIIAGGSGTEVVAVADDNYSFVDWSDGLTTATRQDTNVVDDLSVTANFVINEYTVTFLVNGETFNQQQVEYGSAALDPGTPSVTGYSFVDWDADFSVVTSDLTINAIFAINTYTVTFLDWDGTVLDTQTVNWNTAATAPADPTREGYIFTGWSVAFDVITANLDVTAQYDINTFTVRFLDWDGAELSSQTVNWNTAATAPADPTREGYTFTGWSVAFDVITANLDVTAEYDINTFTVRFLDYNGDVLKTETVDWNTAATAPADPTREGYIFTGWSVAFDVITADLDVTAQYDINTFTVRFFNWDGRLLDTQTVDWNTAAVEPTTPEREGYDFVGWDVAIDAVTADIDATATFTIKVFRVEFLNDDAGILSIQNVVWRQAAVPPISPSKEGYNFVGWDKPYDSITEDIIIYAQYERIMLTVEAVVQKAFGFGLVDPAEQRVEYGGNVEFRAHVGARYRVKSVSTDCGVDIDVERVIYSLSGITESCKVEFEYERRPTSILHLLLGADPQQGSGAKP